MASAAKPDQRKNLPRREAEGYGSSIPCDEIRHLQDELRPVRRWRREKTGKRATDNVAHYVARIGVADRIRRNTMAVTEHRYSICNPKDFVETMRDINDPDTA